MAADTRTTFKSSELSRGSADVFAAASDYPVTVTRRDGEALVLMSEREANARNELLALAAQLIGVATTNDGSLTRFMANHYPWMLALTPADQEECARDVLDSARASLASGQPHLAVSTLTSWRETATAIAAGLGDKPVEWLADDAPVARP